MDRCFLIKPDISFDKDIMAFRQEMLEAGSSMDGTWPLIRTESTAEWLDFHGLAENGDGVSKNRVSAGQYIYVREADGKIVGMIQFRPRFNDYLEKYGGNIGYSVRPDERRKGYAKRMLADCLRICRDNGCEKVLVTCNPVNEGSRRTILANGGVYECTVFCEYDGVHLERYWVALQI